jgi:cell division septation protein DedD
VLITGCASTAEKQTAATAPDDKPYRLESEGQVPPPAPEAIRKDVDRVDVFEETPVAEGAFAVEAVEAVEADPIVEDVAVDSLTMTGAGYRIQVFATGDRHRAESFEMEVETRLNVAAYIEHMDGIYKVRVGDCRSREEAEQLRGRCRTAGYKDAWIVSSEVRFPKPTPGTPVPEKG